MPQEQQTVGQIFRRAEELRRENPKASYTDLRAQLLKEYRGAPLPPTDKMAIPEQDARAPEEDWSSGLSLMMRGIQRQDWGEVMDGILLSLEQTENYHNSRGIGLEDDGDWHDRSVGIREQLEKVVSKWMLEDLINLAERSAKQ